MQWARQEEEMQKEKMEKQKVRKVLEVRLIQSDSCHRVSGREGESLDGCRRGKD